jgi:hypothetical protein
MAPCSRFGQAEVGLVHAIRYDESMEHVLEELEGELAEAAYGASGSGHVLR